MNSVNDSSNPQCFCCFCVSVALSIVVLMGLLVRCNCRQFIESIFVIAFYWPTYHLKCVCAFFNLFVTFWGFSRNGTAVCSMNTLVVFYVVVKYFSHQFYVFLFTLLALIFITILILPYFWFFALFVSNFIILLQHVLSLKKICAKIYIEPCDYCFWN